MNISKSFNVFVKSIKKHSPEILTGIGITGMIFSIVKAVHDTPKALKILDDEKKPSNYEERYVDKEFSAIEKIKLTWKCYIPTALIATGSVVCIIAATATNYKRTAALTTACTLSSTALKEYKDSVVKVVGEAKNNEIKKDIAEKKIKKIEKENKSILIPSNNDKVKFVESFTGQIFESDVESVRKAINNANDLIRYNSYVSLNEVLYELGLKSSRAGELLGWKLEDGYIDIKQLDEAIVFDGKPVIVLDYKNPPVTEYEY